MSSCVFGRIEINFVFLLAIQSSIFTYHVIRIATLYRDCLYICIAVRVGGTIIISHEFPNCNKRISVYFKTCVFLAVDFPRMIFGFFCVCGRNACWRSRVNHRTRILTINEEFCTTFCNPCAASTLISMSVVFPS